MARQKQSGRAAKSTKSEGEENLVRLEGEEVEAALAEARAMLKAAPRENTNGPPAGRREHEPEVSMDAGSIIRPEQFYHPEVSGLTVPITIRGDGNGKPSTRWFVYLHHAKGNRDYQALGEQIQLPSGTVLTVEPMPDPPGSGVVCDWSRAGREDWYNYEGVIDPVAIFKSLCNQIRRYLVFPRKVEEGTVATVALWVVLTYVYQAWEACPYLYVGGPFGSGKSRVLLVLKELVFRPTYASHITQAVVFRTLDRDGGTLLYDEAEQLKGTEKANLRAVLLAGNQKGGTAIVNVPGGGERKVWEPKKFRVYGPKALASIERLPTALASRCILIPMMKPGTTSAVSRRGLEEDRTAWKALRDSLHALALTYGQDWLALSGKAEVVPEGIHDRNYQLWQPLLALAAWFQEKGVDGLLDLVRRHALAAVELSKGEKSQEDAENELLLRVLTAARREGDCPTNGEVLRGARERRRDLFKDWTEEKVGARLRTYGLYTKALHRGRCYETPLQDLYEIQEGYGFDLGLKLKTPAGK